MPGGKFSVEAIFRAVDRMSAPVVAMNARVGKFTKSLEGGLRKLDTLNSRVSGGLQATAGALAAAGAAAGAAGYSIARTGIDFEQAITNVGAVSLMTRDQVKELEAEALRLGKTTKFSAIEVANGMELMGRAGFTNAQVLETVGGVLAAAAAEGAEFAEVASVVSNTLNGMGFEKTAQQTQRIADVLTLASARTNSSITSLGESMKNLAPIARQFGIPFESAVASVALLQDVGIDASEAGTSMATMLTKLATPTDGIKAKMRQLGVTFQDAKGNMLPLEQVFANFGEAAKKSGGNMKTAAFFAELVGLRGQRAALNMQEMFKTGKFDDLAKELLAAAGSAEKMAKLRMNTLGGDLTILGNTVDDLKISLFDMQSGPLRDVVQRMTAWITANKGLITAKFQEYVTWLVDHLPQIVTWLERIGKAVVVFYAFSTAVKATQFAIEAYEAAVAICTGAHWLFVKSLGATQVAINGAIGVRAALNATKLATAINGVSAAMGVGLVVAAGAAGYMFGSWLNTTFQLDEKISGLIAKMMGLDDQINKAGGRSEKSGLDPKGDRHFSDGSIQSADGTWKYKSPARYADEAANAAFRPGTMLPESTGSMLLDGPLAPPQVLSPQARIAESITQTTETQKVELTVKAPAGTVQVTKEPKKRGNTNIRLQPSGAF